MLQPASSMVHASDMLALKREVTATRARLVFVELEACLTFLAVSETSRVHSTVKRTRGLARQAFEVATRYFADGADAALAPTHHTQLRAMRDRVADRMRALD